MMFSSTKPLIAGTLPAAVIRECDLKRACSDASIHLALATAARALRDQRDTHDKVLDSVVDRLLKELSW